MRGRKTSELIPRSLHCSFIWVRESLCMSFAIMAFFSLIAVPDIPRPAARFAPMERSEEHTSELQSHVNLVCRLLLEKKKPCLILPINTEIDFDLLFSID